MILRKDFVGGIAAVVIGGVYLYFATGIRTSPLADTTGPSGLPRVLGMLMIGLGLMLCLQSWYVSYRSREPVPPGEWAGQGRNVLRAGGLLLLGILYLSFVQTLGYAPAIALLIMLASLYLGAALHWRVIMIGSGGGLLLWTLFDRLLGIDMPAGILF